MRVATMATNTSNKWRSWLRITVVGSLIVVSCIALSAYVLIHWVERQILNTDNYVALVGPLPQKPVVSTALGNLVADKVFDAAPVEEKIKEALPERAAFLASPLTSQLQDLTRNLSRRLVASDGFQTIWVGANRTAMNRLVSQARGQPTELQKRVNERFNIDISGVREGLRTKLGTSATAIPALEQAQEKAVEISTNLHAKRETLHTSIRAADMLAVTLPLLVIACFLWGMAWSLHRRRTALVAFTLVIIFMLIEIIALKWARQQVLDQVRNPANLSAVAYIFDSLVAWLFHMIYVVIWVAVAVLVLLMAAGPARWAQQLRQYIRLDRVRQSSVLSWWREARAWLKRYEYYVWLGATVFVFVLLAASDRVTSGVLTNYLLLLLSIFALVHICATPRFATSRVEPQSGGEKPKTNSRKRT
jgi:hypothetical protein